MINVGDRVSVKTFRGDRHIDGRAGIVIDTEEQIVQVEFPRLSLSEHDWELVLWLNRDEVKKITTLADLYDADLRTRDDMVRDLAGRNRIPHPLKKVQYADGVGR